MMRKILLLTTALFCWVGCEPPPEKNRSELIEEEVAARLQRLRDNKTERCDKQLFTDAAEIADSILLVEARFFLDTMTRPDRPERPLSPGLPFTRDTSSIHRLFNPDSLITTGSAKNDLVLDEIALDSLPLDSIASDSLMRIHGDSLIPRVLNRKQRN